MLLTHLLPLHFSGNLNLENFANIEVSNIEIDSRLAKAGSIFFALKGYNVDGINFIDSAFEKGASVAFCADEANLSSVKNLQNKPIIKVKNVYQTLIEALQNFYPNLPENILAITGTNGKTSVAHFIFQMQEIIGKKAASIGTIGIKTSDKSIQKKLTEFELTTPDIVSLYKNLAILKQHGVNDIAIETSSIGLEQNRLAGLKIGLGAFTNFSQDHLDHHQTMEKYFDCKMLLFKQILPANSIAVLNANIAEFEQIKAIALKANLKVFAYQITNQSTNNSTNSILCCYANQSDAEKSWLEFINGQNEFKNFALETHFQNANILCAFLAVVAYYQPNYKQIELLIANLSKLHPAAGRMELVTTLKNNAKIFIDYAHTPDAIKNVLDAGKQMKHNNLHILFGCGGDRDKGKRPQMGKIASDLADFIIVSDDNPRTEDAEQIRKEILSACNLSKTTEIANRKNAIHQAISMLQDNDILIIAGKGHEKYQIIGREKFEFDENKIAQNFIANNFL